MKVLIIKKNEALIESLVPGIKFEESTKNTSTFKITPMKFTVLRNTVRDMGYNPYALMTW